MKTHLFNEFPPISAKTWKQKIQYGLKGKDYTKNLVWESPEDIRTKPFYHAEDLGNVILKPSQEQLSWQIGQEIFVADTQIANAKALDILQRGVESLIFTVPSEAIDLEHLLSGIDLKTVPIHFNFQFLSSDYLQKVNELTDGSEGNIHLSIDIIGNLARTGNWSVNKEKDFEMLDKVLTGRKKGGTTNTLGVDATLYQNAGANMVQQLAYALAHANEYPNRFDPGSVGEISFTIAVGGNYFFEIAKIRALRMLWNALAAEYQVSTHCHILAVPSKRNKTLYDYNLNMLRSTTECMSAILGGADTVRNLPYDSLYHKENEFAERIARNQLLLLKEESYFDAIENPSSGSYYIESLTQQLAEKALVLFKDVEANGGFLKQLENNSIQRKIKESAKKEQHLFDSGEDILVGTNAYQNREDKMTNNLELYPFLKTENRKTLIEPIIEERLAEGVEKQRLKGEDGARS